MKRNEPVLAAERIYEIERGKDKPISSYFGEDTFSRKVMQDKLPKNVYDKIISAIEDDKNLDIDTANAVAHAMKEWAIERGATHFAHWFQPMTGATAEKHDAFVDPVGPGEVMERFSGKQLVQGEPDASSFPSGGLRATFEARGYTAWDMTSPAFLRMNGIGTTLCIPTAFISYTGEALDKKTPLLRSVRAVNNSAMRVLRLLGNNTSKKITSSIGPEQEYFLIDKDYFFKRQDLVLAGRTVIGAPPAKGQELEDQYFGSIKERVQSYMHDVEEALFRLGIPAKTRHNEVAPSQFEIAPVYEEANLAVDHNQLVMDTLKMVSKRHNLSLLLHEKPFAGINGSGKHVNWSLSTDDGVNLLNPGDTPHDNIQFLIFLIATIKAVHKHADLLRASVGSAANDHRLGANEAPPAIISIFLGDQLTNILEDIEKGNVTAASDQEIIDMGLSAIPQLKKDNTDRNRTSPFAFTGNKFEFRAVGSSQSIAFPVTVLNTIVAESLDEVAAKLEKNKGSDIKKAVIEIVREELKDVKSVLFNGDNYADEWHKEAEKRGLPNLKTTPEALRSLVAEKALKLFEKYGVLSQVELKSRYHIRLEKYAKDIEIEAKALKQMVMTQVIPAAVNYQKHLASAIGSTASVLGGSADLGAQKDLLGVISKLINDSAKGIEVLREKVAKAEGMDDVQKKADFINSDIKTQMAAVRKDVDRLETLVDDELWQIPKFWEMLFIC
ncbi:MAG: glutamine synthetase type III [Spirochaetae bacterium HGW-Spirochaetae-1]|jgi:glutamine synthetase|nr:MAG: glutamine synthetase type III [Spirochaetae bacterium HGW-Spirochaetae-1]